MSTTVATTAAKAALQAPVAVAPSAWVASSPFIAKAIVGVALVGLVAVGGHAISTTMPSHNAASAPVAIQPPPVATAPTIAPSATLTAEPITTAQDSPTQTPPRTQASVHVARASASADTTSGLSDDVKNLREAQAALVAGDPQGALAATIA
ncbi:MAG: hypothetical protein ABI421_00615 [Polyangiaceae bacterium]